MLHQMIICLPFVFAMKGVDIILEKQLAYAQMLLFDWNEYYIHIYSLSFPLTLIDIEEEHKRTSLSIDKEKKESIQWSGQSARRKIPNN